MLIGVHIADDVIVGANAVVSHSVDEPNIVVAGIPARKISNKGLKIEKKYKKCQFQHLTTKG